MTFGPTLPEYREMDPGLALTRARVLAAIPAAGTTRAAVAEALGVPGHDAGLALTLFHLAQDKLIAVHADGTIRHYRQAPE